ncbi:microfibril-associated glycoprotein 4-like [Haliotis rufescens]|uniref:microfibril-associated glycoprotein 4-like n=1 Tax=Haliotis rufescens TaxID=6454 RepID=UPI00201F74BB|nr:microfibril-associated glycoprotein 4-like [Haliotis rufescens]
MTTTYRMFDNLNSPCQNGGVRVPGSGNCTCFGGYVGLRCERLMLDCAEGTEWGFLPPDHVAMIHPYGSPKPFLVFCEENPWDTRTYIMARSPGTLDFYRDWAAYKGGFGDLDEEFWLGLDNVHYLTNSRSQNLIAEVHTKMPSNIYLYRQRTYSMFTVGAESTGYVMSFAYNWETAPPHDIGDCLTPMKGKKFSTFDVDNDDDPGRNCAAVHQGAWWFTACGDCNPTGPLTRPNDGYLFNVPNETFWYPGIPNYSLLQVKLFLIPT